MAKTQAGTARKKTKAKKSTAPKKTGLSAELAELKEQVEKLKNSTKKQRKQLKDLLIVNDAFQCAGQALIITDDNARIQDSSSSFQTMLQYDAAELAGKSVMDFMAENMDSKLLSKIKTEIREKGNWHGELIGRRKDEEVFPAWIHISTIKAGKSKSHRYAATVLDLTDIKENEQRLTHMAYYDGLTSLPNRTLLMDRLEHALILAQRAGYSVGIIYLDLDHFKEINDTLGHNVGDQMLVESAKRLKEVVRESDTVSRLGGDEFLILLPDVGSSQNATHISQKILEIMAEPFMLADHELFISASLGISLYPADSTDADVLVMNADTAMYHAKAQGKNNFKFFTEDINKSTVQRFILETRFRRALDKLEFHLNYQPKVDLKTGKIGGAEALLRWFHPEQGSVKPALFIPMAEETGLVLPLGEWALREACRQNKAWQDDGLRPIRISVNLSARQIVKRDILDVVKSALTETGLDPKYLMLEITETMIIDNIESTILILKAFRKMGVGISVDDFGTGYSSLNYINRFPIDELKIDQSFIAELNSDDNKKVVSAIISLGHSLKHKVVAEGVEKKEQLKFLCENNCNEVQGYYFSKPLNSEDFHKMLEDDRKFFFYP